MNRPTRIQSRPLHEESDFWQVHQLLVETYPITPLGFNWDIRRWEGKRFYAENPGWSSSRLLGRVQLWQTNGGRLVGAVNPEGDGDLHLQVHPDFRQLENAMVAWAEQHLAVANPAGKRQLETFVCDYNSQRQHLLTAHGYSKQTGGGAIRRLQFEGLALEPPSVIPGYLLRTTNPDERADCQHIADLLNAAFNRSFHNATEYQNFTKFAPCFRRGLDLVAVAADGSFAAYVGVPYDEANQRGIFEPVCTHPDHRQRGLARSLMLEGLQRLKALGAVDVTVDTGDMIPANRLYDSIGFTEVCKGHHWRREW